MSPPPRAHGDAVVTLTLDPGAGGPVATTSYHHTVIANVPPTISAFTNMTLPQNVTPNHSVHHPKRSLAARSAQTSNFRLAILPVDERLVLSASGYQRELATGFDDVGPSQNLVGDLGVRVIDGSGDFADSFFKLTTVPQNLPPTVLGAGSALSLNRYADQGQSATEVNASDLALNATGTIEAWIRPRGVHRSLY